MEDAKSYASRWTVERIVKEQSGHVPVPIEIVEKPGEKPKQIADGSALWTKQRATSPRKNTPTSIAASPASSTSLPSPCISAPRVATNIPGLPSCRTRLPSISSIPTARAASSFTSSVFITDDADLLPRYLRFVRGLIDTSDLPLNVSREMIQQSPILAAIRKGLTSRILTSLEKLAESDNDTFIKVWEAFGTVLKEGIYEDYERRAQLMALARFKSTASGDGYRSLADYVKDMKEGQTAIYYLAGGNTAQLAASPHIEGFRARGVEVLLLTDPVDSFWVTNAPDFDGKSFKSVSQGSADLADIKKPMAKPSRRPRRRSWSAISSPLPRRRWAMHSRTSGPPTG